MVVADFFAHSFAYDSRLWQTLVPLMTKPGWVTKENLRERWVKYVPPLRLYLVISLLFFASLSFVLRAKVLREPDETLLHASHDRRRCRPLLSIHAIHRHHVYSAAARSTFHGGVFRDAAPVSPRQRVDSRRRRRRARGDLERVPVPRRPRGGRTKTTTYFFASSTASSIFRVPINVVVVVARVEIVG